MNTNQSAPLPAADLDVDAAPSLYRVKQAIMNAALQFQRAGVNDGRLQITSEAAIAAAAETFQRVYDSEALERVMKETARRTGVGNAYQALHDAG